MLELARLDALWEILHYFWEGCGEIVMSDNAYYAGQTQIESNFLFDTNIFSQTKHQKKEKEARKKKVLYWIKLSLQPFTLELGWVMGQVQTSLSGPMCVKLHISPWKLHGSCGK